MIKVHEYSSTIGHHQQSTNSATSFFSTLQTIVQTISSSVQPDVPSIIETKNLPTFAFSRSTCESLNADQKKQILGQVKTAKSSITSLKKNTQDDKITADADNSFQYLSVIENLLSRNCGDLTTYLLIGPTPYQTNVNTKNSWILGGITFNDLIKDYTNRINTYNNVTNCGNDTPFWNGLKCIACSAPNPIFNIATSQCTVCPKGTAYNDKTHTCDPTGIVNYKPNPAAEPNVWVPPEAAPDALPTYMNTGDEPCPVDKPFAKGTSCVACPTDKPYFNLLSKECQGCPVNYVWNVTIHRCNLGSPNATDVDEYHGRLVMNHNSTDADWDKYVKENANKIYCP